MSSGNGFSSVADAKISFLTRLCALKSEDERRLGSYVIFKKPKDSSLFFCLTTLMREFVAYEFSLGYEDAGEEIHGVCFDRCIEIIQEALDAAVAE